MNRIFYILHFLQKLSFFKIRNVFLVDFGFILSKIFKKVIVLGKPHTVTIEPTNICNLSCPECPAGIKTLKRKTGTIDIDIYKKIIIDTAKHTSNLILYFQGEPFLHKSFIDLLTFANKKKIFTSTSTNAQLLTDDYAKQIVESGLNRLIISLDGTTQDTYQAYRIGGDLQKTLDGIKHIVKWKKLLNIHKPFIICQFLILKQNEHQVFEAKKLVKKMGADKIIFKTAQFYDFKNGNTRIPLNEKFTRYKKGVNNTYTIKTNNQNLCYRLWSNIVITWNGNVNLCCFDKDSEYSIGNINSDSISKIWFGKPITEYRKSFIIKKNKPTICSNCTNGLKAYVKI